MNGMESVDDEVSLLAPFEYIRTMSGKQIRSKLSLAFNEWLDVEHSLLTSIMEIVEMLHNASLMIDDIEDSSVLRRGLPVTHSIYGTPRTINTANYVYFVALEKCLKLNSQEATQIFTEQLLELHKGQGKELFWRDSLICPNENQYEMMVIQKTGGLFFLAVRLMSLFSTKKKDFHNLLRLLALYFQIRDDYLNLVSSDMAKLKTVAEDLTEGKFSFPIIHSIQNFANKHDDPVLNILRQRTTSVDVKQYCIKLMEERGSFRYTVERLNNLSEQINNELVSLGGNRKLEDVMSLLQESILSK
ncbi:unnamed protein product [Auanema sp. JU1783]|nr:unnamed protein product [Auanema sp. JU1783]